MTSIVADIWSKIMLATQKIKLPLGSDVYIEKAKPSNVLVASLAEVRYSEGRSAFSIFKNAVQQPIKTEDVVCRIFD